MKVIIEKAFVKYDKKGEYERTLTNNYLEFETEEKAREYINNNIEKDIEFYLYKTEEDVEESNHFDVIISNEILNKKEV